MNIIVTADRNWGIGFQGGPLVRIPADLKLLREELKGKVAVMGRKTMEGMQGLLPMTRQTIVLSRYDGCQIRGAVVCHDLEELRAALEPYRSEDIFVLGGDSVYKALLPWCDTVHVTRIDHAFSADIYFEDLDKDEAWEITADSDEQTYFDLEYRFLCYQRK